MLLRWDWEVRVPELDNISVFIIPGTWVKNSDDRLVVLNDQAKAVIEEGGRDISLSDVVLPLLPTKSNR